MPVIPEFVSSVPYQDAPPDAKLNPTALAAGANAVADSMERVSSQFAQATAFYQQNQAAATAIAKSAGLAMDLEDKKLGYLKDPDPATAAQRFKADVLGWSQQKLGEISDPLVRAHVAENLSRQTASAYATVAATSLSAGARNQQSDVQQGISTQAQLLASAADPLAAANAAGSIRQAVAGAVAGGIFDHGAAAAVTSKAFRDAIVIKAATDPLAAQTMLEGYKTEMTADDVAATTDHLRGPLIRQMGDKAAGATNGAAGGRAAPIVATDLPPEAAQLLPALAGGESPAYNIRYTPRGGATFDGYGQHPQIREPTRDGRTSDAAGRYQFLSSTYAPLAQKLGLPDFSPASQDKAAWQLAADTYQQNTQGRDLAADLRAGGHEADISQALHGVWPSLPGGSQQNTSPDTWRMRLAAGGSANGIDGPPLAARIADVRQRVASDVPQWAQPEVLRLAESEVTHHYTLDQAGMADQRSELHRDITNLQAGYEQGLTTPEIPEARIRILLKPLDAQAAIQTLRDTRVAGDLFKAVQWATPEQEQAARQQLAVPGSIRASMPTRDGKTLGAPADTGDTPPEDAEVRNSRLRQLAKYDELLKRKHDMLTGEKADPAAYVASAPDLRAKFQGADVSDPAVQAAMTDASLAAQARLGVPESQRRVTTNAFVSQTADQLHRLDPAKGDAGAALDQLAKQSGEHWPDVMGELSRYGHIDPKYMVLASMDAPAQAGGRQDMQRALLLQTAKGPEKFVDDAPKAEVKAINDGLDTAMEPFRATTAPNGVGGMKLFGTMRDSVKTLATYYAAQGVPGSTALDRAVAALLTDKYDMDGALRVPKGQLDAVRTAGALVQQNLAAGDLIARPELNAKTPDERAAIMLSAARRGTWATNAKDDGAQLMGAFRDGPMVMRRPDGSPIEIKWKALPTTPMAPIDASPAIVPGL